MIGQVIAMAIVMVTSGVVVAVARCLPLLGLLVFQLLDEPVEKLKIVPMLLYGHNDWCTV